MRLSLEPFEECHTFSACAYSRIQKLILVLFPRAVINFANPHEDIRIAVSAAISAWSAENVRVRRKKLLFSPLPL